MNLLPFLFALLLVLAMGAHLTSTQRTTSVLIASTLEAKERAARKAANQVAHLLFNRARPPKPPISTSSTDAEKPKEEEVDKEEDPFNEVEALEEGSTACLPPYFRHRKHLYAIEKFNLSLVLKHPDMFYEPVAILIKSLYEKAPGYTPGCERALLDTLTQKGEKEFTKLLHKQFPKFALGTATYTVEPLEGYPAFWDEFTLTEGKRVLVFPYLSKRVLAALLGDELAASVEREERSPARGERKALRKREFQELMNKRSAPLPFPWEEFFHFSYETKGEPEAALDLKTNFLVRLQ